MMKNLKILREKHDLSQQQVSDYLNISRQMYLKYESGEVDPPLKVLTLLTKLYQISYDRLINDSQKTFERKKYYAAVVEEPSPVFGACAVYSKESVFQKKLEGFTEEQKQIVFNLIDSIANMNKSFSLEKKQRYREPGAMKGKFYIAPDFDETPDDFKDYM